MKWKTHKTPGDPKYGSHKMSYRFHLQNHLLCNNECDIFYYGKEKRREMSAAMEPLICLVASNRLEEEPCRHSQWVDEENMYERRHESYTSNRLWQNVWHSGIVKVFLSHAHYKSRAISDGWKSWGNLIWTAICQWKRLALVIFQRATFVFCVY